MTPTKFPQSNVELQAPKGMYNCEPLYVFTDGNHCISQWRLTWRERLKILIGRPVWLWVVMSPQPPVALTLDDPFKKG